MVVRYAGNNIISKILIFVEKQTHFLNGDNLCLCLSILKKLISVKLERKRIVLGGVRDRAKSIFKAMS